MATMKLAMFDISRCGYYRRGHWSAPQEEQISWVMRDLENWASSLRLKETKTFTPSEDDDLHPVYCFDVESSVSGNFVITTWNEVPMAEGGVATASGDSAVGAVDVSIAEVDEGAIPGFATYFYVVPAQGIVITVRPEGKRHNGRNGFERYIQAFLTYFSSAVVREDEVDGVDAKVIGYSIEGEDEPQQLLPVFSTQVKKVAGQLDYIRQHRGSIRKLVRRDSLQMMITTDRSFVRTILQNVGLMETTFQSSSVKLAYELEFTPTENELETIIAQAEADHDLHSDVGFAFRGDQEIAWLSHALLKMEIDLPVQPNEAGVLPAAALLEALDLRLSSILSLIPPLRVAA